MDMRDKQILRDLSKRFMEIATSDEQKKANQRMKDSNDLKMVRPPVLLDEIPWHEFQGEADLQLICEDGFARGIENCFRQALYYKKYFKADFIMLPEWRVHMAYQEAPLGIDRKMHYSSGGSGSMEDVLEDERVLEQVCEPHLIALPERDEATVNALMDALGDTMPVRLVGVDVQAFAFWDDISFLRGVEPIYEDMYDRPEYLHRIMEVFVRRAKARIDFIEEHMHVNPDPRWVHCTPGAVSGLAEDGLKATWYRGMAQPFSCVSPAMFKEFELDYIKLLAERFGYTYYGCCEPLDTRIEMLKTIKNLRKLGVSPWADEEKCAEQIRGDYVYARKPNPAHVATRTDPAVIRAETEKTVKLCMKYGCQAEFVLKDITTVSHNPGNLMVWADTVKTVLDEYYDAE